MTKLPTIDRRTWLALWAQGRRRRRARHAQPALLPAPVLAARPGTLLAWDWTLANPYRWNVWTSPDGVTSWTLAADYWTAGDGREFAPDGGSEWYFLVGVNEAGVEITERSNAVRPDDVPAMPPAPVITLFEVIDDGNGNVDINLTWTWDGQGWPEDGVFTVYVSSDNAPGEINAAMVPCPARSCSLAAVLPAADIQYACRVVYVKDATVGTFSDYAYGNPY